MAAQAIPSELRALFAGGSASDGFLDALMPAVCDTLACARSLLFLREPDRKMLHTHGWWRRPEQAHPIEDGWSAEPATIAEDDPLFAEALRNPAALYIDDIEGAAPGVLNLELERAHYRHRAFIHAPIYGDGRLYGILEPCVFDRPREWSPEDRAITAWLQERLGPIAAEYVAANAPR